LCLAFLLNVAENIRSFCFARIDLLSGDFVIEMSAKTYMRNAMKINDKSAQSLLTVLAFGAVLFFSVGLAGAEEYDADTYGPEEPIVFAKPVKAVEFSHKVHTMGAGLECGSCHDDLFQMEAGTAEQSDDFTMEALYAGKYCGACHDGDMAFASNKRCTFCHIGVKGFERLHNDGKAPEGGHGGH
jgi:c(7)-type cytochrome triheme protein